MEGPPLGPGGEDIPWPDQVAPRGRKASSTRKIKPQTSNLYNTITYPYTVPRLERLLRMFGHKFGRILGMEVFKALLKFSEFVQHATKKLSCILSPIL